MENSHKSLKYCRIDVFDKEKAAAEGQVSSLSEQLITLEKTLKSQHEEKCALQEKTLKDRFQEKYGLAKVFITESPLNVVSFQVDWCSS